MFSCKRNASLLSLLLMLVIPLSVMAQPIGSFSVRNASVEDCLKEIERQTGLGYLFADGEVSAGNDITYSARNVEVSAILQAISDMSRYRFTIDEGVILVTAKPAQAVLPAQPNTRPDVQSSFTLRITFIDDKTRERVYGAVVMIRQYAAYAIAFDEGVATLSNLPPGKALLETQMLGYETTIVEVDISRDAELTIRLQQTSLELEEVTVVAKASAAGTSTSSTIGRQAMDHLQATSLLDVMQLLPGQLMTGVSSLTSAEKVTIRTLNTSNVNNAFGTSVVVDGVPLSDNASMEGKTGVTATGGTGVDLREIGTDNIESIEVIRGIPSAEYGDLTSGAVIVNTKAGQSPFEVRAKINPITFNTSFNKGWRLEKGRGSVNANVDYAQAWGDPRQKTTSFDRVSGGLTYTRTLKRVWYTNTRINVSNLLDFRGTDPDVITEGTETRQNSFSLRFGHNGRIGINAPLMRTLSYSVGFSQSINESFSSTIVAAGGGLPIITSMTPGYMEVPYISASYRAAGGTESRPGSVFAKITNAFFWNTGKLQQRFNMGGEYRLNHNNARGFYNEDDAIPLRPNSNGRPRPFYDIPALTQVSGFFEDNINWRFADKRWFRLQAGIRYDLLQPGMAEQVSSLSPRFNASLKVNEWLEFRGGWGRNTKTPGLSHLYPEARYSDRLVAEYLPADPARQLVMYQTYINFIERSLQLKNSVNIKSELGVDVGLPNEMTFSVVAYQENLRGGFGNLTDYLIYYSHFYAAGQGVIVVPDSKPVIDWNDPLRIDTVFTTRGTTGNTQASLDRGIEFDFFFGQIKPIRTQLYFSGAFMESSSWATGPNFSNPVGIPPSSAYGQGGSNTPPFKIEYPSGLQKSISKRFSSVLRAVSNFPQMRMVASLNGQVIWYTYSKSTNQRQYPIGWLDTDLSYHPITSQMLENPDFTIKGISLADQIRTPRDTDAVILPPVWLVSARLTKEISKAMRLSFFVSNLLYYTPFQTSNVSGTLIERNANSFSFGMEFFIRI